MTGAGAPGAAGIIKCLLQDSAVCLTIADADGEAMGKHLHPDFFQIPKAGDEKFSEAILAICKQRKIEVVMPLVTRELFPFSQNRQRFLAEGVKILVSSAEAIEVANDKAACYAFLRKNGIAVPAFHLAKKREDFMQAAEALGYPHEPFCFKPCVANGSRGFRIVSDFVNEADLLFCTKPYQTYISYAQAVKILSSQAFPPLVVTEYLPGEEYSVDCLANLGESVLIVPRLRTKMINGISVQGKFVNEEDIVQYCKQIIKAIGLHGNIGIQLRRSKTGEPLLLEINPRAQGTIVSALGAGVNLPLLAVKQELGLSISPGEKNVSWGTSFSRYWTEVFY